MADTVQVRFSASIKDLIEATNSVKSAIDGVVEKAQAAGEAMQTFGEIAGIGLSVEAVKRFVESMAELGEKTEQIGARLGLSAEQVGILGGVAKLGGVDIDTLATSFERMSLNVQKSTKDAFNPAAQGLKVLHLNARDLIGLPADEYFRRLASAVSQFNPSLNLTNALTAVGGRGVTQLMFALREAGVSWDDWTAKIKQTGAVLTDQQAHAFAETNLQIKLLGMSAQGAGNAIFDGLNPAIQAVVGQMAGFLQEIRDSIKEGGAWSSVLNGLSGTIKAIATAFAGVAAMIHFLAAEAKAFWDTTAENGKKVADNLRADLDSVRKDFQDTLSNLWGPTKVTVTKPAGGGRDAAAMNTSAKAETDAQMEAFQNNIKLNDEKFKAFEQELTSEVKLHQITEDQKTQQLVAAIKERQQYDLQQLDFEEQLGGLSVAQRQKIEDLKKQFVQKSNQEIQQAQAAALQADVREWEAALKPIESAWNSQLRALLAGTETFGQAMKKIFADLAIQAIEKLESIAMTKLATQLASQFGGLSNLFGGGGAGGAAGAAGSAPQVAATTANTTALSALTTAIAANTTALTGEAAAAAGQGASGIGSFFSTLASFLPGLAVGAWNIPSVMPAMLHPGEMVIPSGVAGRLRDGLSGGGARMPEMPAFAAHSSSVDSRTLNANFNYSGGQLSPDTIRQHIRTIANELNSHWITNPTTRPRGW